jgi:hypothetical protein
MSTPPRHPVSDRPWSRTRSVTLAGLYAAALLPRLAWVLVGCARHMPPRSYFDYAIREGPFWDPFPRLLFTAIEALTGHRIPLLLVVYALLAAAIAPLTYALTRSLGLPHRTGLIAGLIAAIYPYYVSTAFLQPTVSITILLFALVAVCAAALLSAPSTRASLLCVLFAAILLTDRSHAITYVAFMVGFAAVVQTVRWPRRRGGVLLVGLLAVAVLGIAGVRYSVYGQFSPLTQKGGYNLLLGHNPAIQHYLESVYDQPPEYYVYDSVVASLPESIRASDPMEPRYDGVLRARAYAYIGSHPLETLVNAMLKIKRYWDVRLEDSEGDSMPRRLAYAVPYAIVLAFGMVGAVRLLRARRGLALAFLAGGIVSLAVVPILTLPLIRVRMFAEFLLFVIAAAGLTPGPFDEPPPAAEQRLRKAA